MNDAKNQNYPCSPLCEGYLREQTLRRWIRDYLRLDDLIGAAAILGRDSTEMEEKREKLRSSIDMYVL